MVFLFTFTLTPDRYLKSREIIILNTPLSTNIIKFHFVYRRFLLMYLRHAILKQDKYMMVLDLLPSIRICYREVYAQG